MLGTRQLHPTVKIHEEYVGPADHQEFYGRQHPLHAAISAGDEDAAAAVLSSRPELAKEATKVGWLPHHTAAFHGSVASMKLLLEAHKDGAKAIDKDGYLAHHICTKQGQESHLHCLKMLLAANPKGGEAKLEGNPPKKGCTPLDIALAPEGILMGEILSDAEKALLVDGAKKRGTGRGTACAERCAAGGAARFNETEVLRA